jgi:hypothetical protein
MKETTEDERNEARHVSSPERPYDEPSGYGACSKCNCPGFDGNDGTCASGGCGHAYGDHW